MLFIRQKFKENKTPLLISFSFLIINLVQACFTPLLNDESYYWLYAQDLQWGYFDHPPFIALLIKISTQLFSSEAGIRFLPVLMGAATIFIFLKLIEQETKLKINIKLAVLLLGGSLFVNLYSFLAIPDTPLLCIEILFFWLYSKYLNNDNWKINLALGVTIALLLYTKYHGVLIIFFTILSNPKILIRKSFYVILLISLLLFIPHIHWLFDNDFRTVRFQLMDRANPGFDIRNVLSYVGEQLGLTGPLFILLFSILYKPKNSFQKTLKYNVIGVFVFFLFCSFRQRLNTYWTDVAWMPMLLLCYLYFTDKKIKNRYLTYLLLLNCLLAFSMRTAFLTGWIKIPHLNDRNLKVMSSSLKEHTGNDKLVFINCFIEPSAYMFYEKQNCFAFNNLEYKRTQFNYLSKYEREVQKKPVVLVSKSSIDKSSIPISIPGGKLYFLTKNTYFKSYYTTISVKASNLEGRLKAGENYVINYNIDYKLDHEELMTLQPSGFKLGLSIKNMKTGAESIFVHELDINHNRELQWEIKLPEEPGSYKCVFFITHVDRSYQNGFNSITYYIYLK